MPCAGNISTWFFSALTVLFCGLQQDPAMASNCQRTTILGRFLGFFTKKNKSRREKPSFRPTLEVLEDRVVPSMTRIGLTARAMSASEIDLSWTTAVNAAIFKVYRNNVLDATTTSKSF